MSLTRLGIAAALIVSCALPAAAQSVSIQFHDGHVTLNASNVPLRTILAEWAKVGGAKIVNGDRVGGAPVTLQLTDATERQALDVLLRGVSGYIVAARSASSAGASTFDRILILPTSAVVRTASVPAPAPGSVPAPGFVPPRPAPVFVPDDPEENPRDDVAPGANSPQGPVTPAQLQQRLREASARAAAQRAAELDAAQNQVEQQQQQPPPPQAPTARPGNPFGAVRGSGRPGEITPVQPQQPRNPLRPNGDPEP